MTAQHFNFIASLIQSMFADRPTQTTADWCCEHLRFDEPDNRGPFSLAGREYSREILNLFADPNVPRLTLVFGSQVGKTTIIMGGTAWIIFNEGSRIFWVMPTRPLVFKFSGSRWQKMIRASPALAERIPTGVRRHDFSTLQQMIGNSIVDFTWAHSPSALSSTPARVVNLDEVDKFPEATAKEADAMDLAEQRTKSFALPKIIATSTPTTVDGLIWQRFLQSDQSRRWMPCPSCAKLVVFAWSKDYTVFPLIGSEAFVTWDREAQRKNGSWDLDRVANSARKMCPHCGFHIRDAHKTLMDRQGLWVPSERRAKLVEQEIPAETGHRGFHLPSLYSPSAQCNDGVLAIKFLQKYKSLAGLQGFINGDLAEPMEGQGRRAQRVEIIVRESEAAKAVRNTEFQTLTADVQEQSPHFWWVRIKWGVYPVGAGLYAAEAPFDGTGGFMRVVEWGHCETYDELRAVQLENKIPDTFVCLDSGDDTQNVYEMCARFGVLKMTPDRRKERKPPLHVGWIPSKGFKTKGWFNQETKSNAFYHMAPLERNIGGRVIAMPLLEFADEQTKDLLDLIRRGKTDALRFEVADSAATDEFWRHMDGEVKKRKPNKRTGFIGMEWCKRSQTWPNHIYDAVKIALRLVEFHRKLPEVRMK